MVFRIIFILFVIGNKIGILDLVCGVIFVFRVGNDKLF